MPDDSGHSPVSDKWELYVISATEVMSPVLIGDVNEDGEVNIADVTRLIDYLLGNETLPFNADNADVFKSGDINIADVTALVDLLLSPKE